VVVVVGVTTTTYPVTAPIPLSIEIESAPFTDQDRVAEAPTTMLAGVAAKEAITGTGKGVTVTVAVDVAGPPALVAVKV
jgi:hypothetical protein